MHDKELIWDPLRKKEVALTPEERVRQWCIGILAGPMKVPMHMMMSEVGFRLGGKQFRADIIIYDRKAQPLAVVECKRPEVVIDQDVLDQAVRYNMVLNVKYMIITNGTRTFICRKEGNGYSFISDVPDYNEMLG
ncbi:MAG: type I restriction enzyme HsdR N-terminal domain-containing protein [Bacteroidales bacterium]|nr:type I restriction enzyme HsdR N-terminal domain-containing protein [Bacteroidales bacterium]